MSEETAGTGAEEVQTPPHANVRRIQEKYPFAGRFKAENIQVGDAVRIRVDDTEDLWVRVAEIDDTYIVGIMDSHPVMALMDYGDKIMLEEKDILDVVMKEGGT